MRDAIRLGLACLLLLGEATVAVAALYPRVSPEYRAFFIDHTTHLWPPCRAPLTRIGLDGPIEPGRMDPRLACALLPEGWAEPESWGVWTEGKTARLALPYRAGTRAADLTLVAHARPGHTQEVAVRVGGREAGRFAIAPFPGTTITVALPPANRPSVAAIELRIAAPFSPKSAGESQDSRKLGVALVRLDRR